MQIVEVLSAVCCATANGMSAELLYEGYRDEGSIWVDVAILNWVVGQDHSATRLPHAILAH